ncbi:MAG: type II toxin-antitoxin system RelE/ParE family toxin [Deltaproteobacteria bacterium]|nr:type II toxin-antitoxin system RelE/ParE family toxin [Deltaproteobacteria bacterium]
MIESISELASKPRPPGCRKLRGLEDVYRIRIGTYRVIYSIDDSKIIILKVGHRGQV